MFSYFLELRSPFGAPIRALPLLMPRSGHKNLPRGTKLGYLFVPRSGHVRFPVDDSVPPPTPVSDEELMVLFCPGLFTVHRAWGGPSSLLSSASSSAEGASLAFNILPALVLAYFLCLSPAFSMTFCATLPLPMTFCATLIPSSPWVEPTLPLFLPSAAVLLPDLVVPSPLLPTDRAACAGASDWYRHADR